MSEIKLRRPLFISRLTDKCATQNLKNIRNTSLWTCLHIMAILKMIVSLPLSGGWSIKCFNHLVSIVSRVSNLCELEYHISPILPF